jgi:hypothetical protein
VAGLVAGLVHGVVPDAPIVAGVDH